MHVNYVKDGEFKRIFLAFACRYRTMVVIMS